MGAWFALAGTDSINDLFFVHQRGFRIGLWNAAVIASVNITPVVSGYVITGLSWRWSFWILAIFFGIVLLCVMFGFPETSFVRENLDNSTRRDSSVEVAGVGEIPVVYSDTKFDSSVADAEPESGVGHAQPVISIWQQILGAPDFQFQPISCILPEIVEPILLLRHPGVIWACAMWSVTFTWVIIQGAVASQIFAAPPYNLSPTAVGNLVGIAPLIGSALGTSIGGWSSDFISRRMSMRNGGIYEPEFRLLVIVPFVIFVAIGSFGLGAAIANGLSVITCGVFLAILNFAVGVGCTGIVSYSNDACQGKAGAAFGITMVSKSCPS